MSEKRENTAYQQIKWGMYSWVALAVGVIALVLLLIVNHDYYTTTYGEKDIRRFEKRLHAKEKLIIEEFSALEAAFESGDPLVILDERSDEFMELSRKKGIFFFYYEKGRLQYWSDHTVPIASGWNRSLERPFLFLPNASYVARHSFSGQGKLLGLIQVKTSFPYENEYLQNEFQGDFKIDPAIGVLPAGEKEGYAVKGLGGKVLFRLDFRDTLRNNRADIILALIASLVLFVSVYLFFHWRTASVKHPARRSLWLLLGIVVLTGMVLFFSWKEYPPVIFESELFHPEVFASRVFPSLGVLLVWVLFMLFISIYILGFFDRSRTIRNGLYPFITVIFMAAGSASLFGLQRLFSTLVLDSNISFETFRLDTLSIYSFLGLLIFGMLMLVSCFFILKALRYRGEQPAIRYYLAVTAGLLAGMVPFLLTRSIPVDLFTIIYLVLFIVLMIYLRHLARNKLRMSSFFLPIILFSLYTSAELQKYSGIKTANEKEVELVKLSSQHDMVAEMLFIDISERISGDSALQSSLTFPYLDIDFVYEYLQREYFSGYWTKYDMQITVCRPVDSVFVEPPVEEWFHCYSFFSEMISTEGVRIPRTNFYFLDNLNGRISYLAVFTFESYGEELSLYLELDSKIISEELGYPELLLSQDARNTNEYDYAIYNKGKLVTSKGEYNYRRTSGYYTDRENTFEFFRSEGYNHSILNVDEENMVIVSSPVVSAVDRLITFSYIFGFYFLVFALTWIFLSVPSIRKSMDWDFKNKIQYSMIGILFLTFVFICAGTIYFIIQQYRDKHHSNLQNTMRSLYIELIHKVEFEDDLRNWSSDSYNNLDELLRKFSNVFYTDINMYDERGILLATSRSEIFNEQLLSYRMNRVAYEKLAKQNYSAFIHIEQVGKLKYQSAYVPLLNSENNLLAYLNLPYFTQPGVLTQEVINLVVAILNIYVILLLTILLLSVFLADRITQPLRVIQNRIAQLSLGKQNEKIRYKGRDEIRGLVEEYNYMVDELQKSAELLAISERETAWREMARQIAHEIKNPLTPMKLNLQHLDRLVTEDSENLEEQVRKVIHTLVEQIDSLTSIANEFSDFAKMPKAKNRRVNLVRKLKNTAQLFQNQPGTVEFELPGEEQLFVFGDPEQIQRVIINLVKNGIQAVPDEREPHILLSMEKTGDEEVLVSIRDNGRGIPEEIRDKLFQPNFTTKSSGMGMGLAISANIIRAIGGEIWFESILDKGTVFFIRLPLDQE